MKFLRCCFRSPPPLPTIFLIGRDLVKTRGGKRGQIASMIRFVREFSAARVTTGFLGTWGLQPTALSKDLSALTRLRNFARRQKAAIRIEPQGWRQWAQAFFGDYVRSCPKQSTSLFNQLLEFRRVLSCRLSPGFANPIAAERWLALGFTSFLLLC